MRQLNFRLLFQIEKVGYWASKYDYGKADAAALEAGNKIREGDYSRSNLDVIVRWKSERRKRSSPRIQTRKFEMHSCSPCTPMSRGAPSQC